MIKGWNTNSQGTYYFDLITGAMAKGTVVIDGITCVFDYNTGILQSTKRGCDQVPRDQAHQLLC